MRKFANNFYISVTKIVLPLFVNWRILILMKVNKTQQSLSKPSEQAHN